MILSRPELIGALNHEIQLILHLAAKAGPEQLEYRLGDNQRSTLDLLRYLSVLGPIHVHGIANSINDMAAWGKLWNEHDALAKQRNFDQTIAAIAALPEHFEEALGNRPDDWYIERIQLFGDTLSRSQWLIGLVLTHYSAYRMQLFLLLKNGGRPELNTFNLWMGVDGDMKPPAN